MSDKRFEVVNLNTWKLDRDGYTAVIVKDASTGMFKPYIRRFANRVYTTVETLEKVDSLHTAMVRCKRWLKKAGKKQ